MDCHRPEGNVYILKITVKEKKVNDRTPTNFFTMQLVAASSDGEAISVMLFSPKVNAGMLICFEGRA